MLFSTLQEDLSPRSDDDDIDLDVYKGALENPYDLLRNHTFFKEEFILEESRPKDPFIQSSSSGSDTVSSSNSSHVSTPRDKIVAMDTKTAVRTGKALTNKNQPNTGKAIGAKSVGMSLNVSKQKLNAKSVPTVKESNDTAKGGSVLTAMAMKNAAVLAASGNNKTLSESKTKPGAGGKKTGGTIIIHGDVDKSKVTSEVSAKGSNVKETEDMSGKQTVESKGNVKTAPSNVKSENAKAVNVNGQKENIASNGDAKPATVTVNVKSESAKLGNALTEQNKTVTSTKDMKGKTASKANQPMQVVPTKLTANAINKNVAKSGVDKIDEKSKTAKPEDNTANKTETKTVSNVKMELSPSAQVISRVNTPQNESKSVNKVSASSTNKISSTANNKQTAQNVSNEKLNDKKQTVNTSDSNSKEPNAKTEEGQNADKNAPPVTAYNNKHSSSAQPANRQLNSPARNPTFTVSRSAGAYQRAAAGSRKSTPNYTPTSVKKSSTQIDMKSDNTNTSKGAKPSAKQVQEKTATAKSVSEPQNSVNVTNKPSPDENEDKTKKPSSPSEINMAPGVCKSSSMLKSYNMASSANGSNKSSSSQPKTPRCNSNLSSNVNSNDTKGSNVSKQSVGNVPNKLNKPNNDNITEDSKSTSVSTVNMVNKSLSQLPTNSNVNTNKSGSAGISRSVSMSLIEEHTENSDEKKKMSSSDTKVQNHVPNSSKQRPLSDGSIATSNTSSPINKALKSNGKAPLIDILPSNSPRISTTNYVEPAPKLSTPVIVNPFEELEKNREQENQQKLGARGIPATEYGFVVEKAGPERSKTQISMKSKAPKSAKRPGYGKETKPSSASTRGSSGRSKRAKSKERKSDDGRPKSGKTRRVRSGKRKRKVPNDNLSKQNDKSDVALIGGIGWHVATSCRDKSEADAVIVSQIDSSDYSEDESEAISRLSPLPFDNPYALNVPNHLESSSAVSSPRFMEVKSSNAEKPVLPVMENDGFPPMNLDMTQMSKTASNPDIEAGFDPSAAVPDDIAELLAKLKAQENAENDDENNDDSTSNTYQQLTSAIHREILKGKLTPIPESPGITRTQSSLQHLAKTVNAITKFDENLKEEDLNKLLGVTPRDKNGSLSAKDKQSIEHIETLANSSVKPGAVPKRPPPPKASSAGKPSQSNKGMIQQNTDSLRSSRNNSSKGKINSSRQTPVSSADRNDRSISFSNRQTPVSSANLSNSRGITPKQPLSMSFNSNILNEIQNNAIMETNRMVRQESDLQEAVRSSKEMGIKPDNNGRKTSASSSDSKSESVKLDLKALLTEKMQNTKKMLEETTNSLKSRSWRNKRKISIEDTEHFTAKLSESSNVNDSQGFEVKMTDNFDRGSNGNGNRTARDETGEIKTARSSRKERKFSEDKSTVPDDENIDNVIDEILSNTYPSAKSKSTKSANSTLTEADRHLLKQMSKHEGSPFYAKEHVRESTSYDDSLTLNKDNPQLLKRFHADKFQMGQKVKAMIDAGADKTKVKAMLDVDNEAKQLAKIMNSFKQMELYAGPHGGISNRSAKKETPRKVDSLSRLEHAPVALMSNRPPGRPGSAGAGKIKPGKFTEIKEDSRSIQAHDRPVSPAVVPQVGLICFSNLVNVN